MEERIFNILKSRGLSENTIKNYLSVLKAFKKVVGKEVWEASFDDIAKFLSNLSPQSRYAYTIALKTILKLLNKPEHSMLKIPKKVQRKYTIIDEDKIREMCQNTYIENPKLAVAIALGYELALRVSEIVNLKLFDIDFESWTVTVERIKSKRVYRLPIVSEWVKELLVKYVSTHPRHTEYLIWSRKKPYKYSVATMSNLISKALKRYGYDKARPHDLRHSRATNLLRMGLDIRALQIFLGHSSISQTEIYTHLTEVDLRKMIENVYRR